MLIDSHLHFLDENNEEIDQIIKRAKEKEVDILILSGSSLEDNLRNINISNNYDNVYITLGYHPLDIAGLDDQALDLLEEQLKTIKKVVAIGEIGLDYHYGKDNLEKQIYFFKKQLDFAIKYKLPVVIHMRDATKDTLDIIKDYQLRGVFHCFSGSLETARKIIDMGYYLGIGGILTFSNSNLAQIVKEIDMDHLILETDSPFLSPLRGKKNEPQNIKIIAEKLAIIQDKSIDEVANITTKNVDNLFDLKVGK